MDVVTRCIWLIPFWAGSVSWGFWHNEEACSRELYHRHLQLFSDSTVVMLTYTRAAYLWIVDCGVWSVEWAWSMLEVLYHNPISYIHLILIILLNLILIKSILTSSSSIAYCAAIHFQHQAALVRQLFGWYVERRNNEIWHPPHVFNLLEENSPRETHWHTSSIRKGSQNASWTWCVAKFPTHPDFSTFVLRTGEPANPASQKTQFGIWKWMPSPPTIRFYLWYPGIIGLLCALQMAVVSNCQT